MRVANVFFLNPSFQCFARPIGGRSYAPPGAPLGAYKVLQFGLFGHFGTHFLAYELSITYMGNHGDVTPEIPHGDVDITSPGVIRIDHEPKMNRSSARVSFEEYLKKGMGFVVFISHFL
jgi:hypothetical protein